jgi:hypothetical protein
VLRFHDPIAFAQFRLEERADAGLEQHRLAVEIVDQSARHARPMRFCSSGAIHCDHMPLGTLPNIAPPSSFCELPRIDQSFMTGARVGP